MKTMTSLFFSSLFVLTANIAFAQVLAVGIKNDGTFEPLNYAPNDVAKVEKTLLKHQYRVTTMIDTQRSNTPTLCTKHCFRCR